MVILLVRKQAIGFFKPSLVVIIVMGIFVSVMFVGHADRYAFTCGGDGHN